MQENGELHAKNNKCQQGGGSGSIDLQQFRKEMKNELEKFRKEVENEFDIYFFKMKKKIIELNITITQVKLFFNFLNISPSREVFKKIIKRFDFIKIFFFEGREWWSIKAYDSGNTGLTR